MNELESGWFIEGDVLFNMYEERATLCLIPAVVISAEPSEYAITFAWLCFSATVGRRYG